MTDIEMPSRAFGSPSVSISRFAHANIADRVGEIGDVESERPALWKARVSAAPACGGVARGEVRAALARLQFRADAVGEETVDHVGTFGELK